MTNNKRSPSFAVRSDFARAKAMNDAYLYREEERDPEPVDPYDEYVEKSL